MKKLTIATNNGDIGGGEVMLLNIARVARSLGHHVTVVGPAEPSTLVEATQDEGFDTIVLPATTRKHYIAQLRAWDKKYREGVLWCNGLVPSFATAGHPNRIVHLHQFPEGKLKYLVPIARRKALVTLVPSNFVSDQISGTETFYNWVNEVPMPLERRTCSPRNIKVGFLGRPSEIKGTDVLAYAIQELNQEFPEENYSLVLAGEPHFVDKRSQEKIQYALSALGQNLELLGWVEPATLMKNVDILVVPSICNEVFGLVAAETMSAKVPLIISDAGALPEILGEGYPWVSAKSCASDLARMIRRMGKELLQSPEELQHTVENLYWRWFEYFSPEAGKARVEELLKRYC
ncbi:glycosyltransferase family 4 protein [Rothia sp. P13129]|uniref:glycosyltransferase family 4 protein n=1 Tax=unclassified Rothia (in: high G+C Gram-positive bacteria) TaxID=2689056 RepID=UPI003ACC7327